MNRKELLKELDALQDRYKIQQKYGRSVLPESAVPIGPAALRVAEERLATRLPPSRAERALEEIALGQALWKKFQEQAEADEKSKELRGPDGVAQRKDGLDMSFHQLLNDASRMRTQLNEIGLQLGQAGRSRALDHLHESRAVPRELQEQYREQQKVLVEQKRLLEQLRHERELAAGDQYWIHRQNRLDHHDNIVGKPGVDPAVPPEELYQAHQKMRDGPEAERIYGWSDPQPAAAPQDARVYAEILRVSRRQQPGTVAELCIIDRAGVTLARCTADFPDQVGERCCMEVTVPATSVNSATAEVSLLGPSLQNTIRVPLVKLKEARGQPQDYTMEGEKPLIVNMDLCCAKPQDSRGHKLQSSRVVENAAGVCPVSDLPGAYPELPASDAHRRAQKAAWERQGRPDYIHDVDLSHNLAHELERRANAVALRKRAPVPSIKAARNDAEPAEPTAPGLRKLPKEERPVQGGFFSGWEEPEYPDDDEEHSRARSDISGASAAPSQFREGSRGFDERGPRAEEEREASLTPRRHHGLAEHGGDIDELDFTSVRPSSSRARLSEEEFANGPSRYAAGSAGFRRSGGNEGVQVAHGHHGSTDSPPGRGAPRSHSQPVTKKKKKAQAPRPYFEAEEIDHTPRDTLGEVPQQSQDFGWMLPGFPFAAFAGFGSAAPSSGPATGEKEEDPASSEAAAAESPQEGLSFASFTLPFAAFAGFGDEGTASKPKAKAPPKPKPPAPKPPKPKSPVARKEQKDDQVKKMAQVGWQPWATYAAEDAEEPGNQESIVLPLRPPHSSRTLDQLYAKLFQRQKDGKLGMRLVGQDVLELAARVARMETLAPNLHEHEKANPGGAHKTMTAYAALILDSMQKYENSSVLGLWCTEALITLFRAGDAYQQAEFCVPFFRAFVGVALRFRDAHMPSLHLRLLQGMADVVSPDCRLCDPGLVDYIIDQLDRNRNKLNTLTVEHALAILCVLRAPHRVSEQIRHCLLVIRGLKSEPYLCVRALVTAAELYEVVGSLIERERASKQNTRGYYGGYAFDEDAQDAFVAELGLPPAGMDVRLVATVMDLYPSNRKLAGAALRAFAAMAKITRKHLQDIVAGEVRPISNTLHEHAKSRSVNLHVAELILLVAKTRTDLVSDGLMMMACKSLRSSTRDAEIVRHILVSLQTFLAQASSSSNGGPAAVNRSLAQALPFDVLVRVGDIHHENSDVVSPLCRCIDLQAGASKEYRDDFVNAGAMAVPLRVFDEAEVHTPEACAASARIMKVLLTESKKAASQFMDAGGPRLLLNVLSKQSDSSEVVHHCFAAMAVAAQFLPVRWALVHPQLPHTMTFLDQILRVADAHVASIADVLPWACLAVGVLTECEHEESQEMMRAAINQDLLQSMLTKMRSHYSFRGDLDFCMQLIDSAASCDLSDRVILSEDGALLKMPTPRLDVPEPPKDFHAETVAIVPEPVNIQGDWHEPLDVFGPLRTLGVGKSAAEFGAAITKEQIDVLRGVASAPVKQQIASQFLRAVRDEYLEGKAGAIETFMTRRGPPEEGDDGVLYEGEYLLTADEQRALRPFIQRMQDAPEKPKEFLEIEHRWNVKAAEDMPEEQGFFASVFGGSTPAAAEPKATVEADCHNVIATGCADGKARIHDVRSGRQLVSTRHDATNRDGINSLLLAPGPRGPILLTGAWDGRWHEWEQWPTRPAKPAEFLRGEPGVGHDNHLHAIALSDCCNYLACACSAGRVLVYRRNCPTREIELADADDVADLKESLKLGDHGEFVVQRRLELAEGAVVVEPQDQLLPEASLEGFKKRSDLDAVELPARFRLRFVGCLTSGYRKAWRSLEHGGAVHCLVLVREGCKEYLYSGSRDRLVRKWSLLEGALELTLHGHSSMVRCLAANELYLASGGDDRSICIWRRDEITNTQVKELECSSRITSHTDFVRAVALCNSFHERLLSAGDDQRVILWNVHRKEKLREYQHPCNVAAVVLMGSALATAGEDGRLRIWNTESAELQHNLKHPQRLTSLSSMRVF
ncbi:mhkB [Symbiodinium natans]|uniref:MhkB protein n=1 Tax=Symbiodinium natans TaxID=878477 RepID=A0A812MDE6_9DINO|nr:mhkB [Symbiodinium natans]